MGGGACPPEARGRRGPETVQSKRNVWLFNVVSATNALPCPPLRHIDLASEFSPPYPQNLPSFFSTLYTLNFAQPLSPQAITHSRGEGVGNFYPLPNLQHADFSPAHSRPAQFPHSAEELPAEPAHPPVTNHQSPVTVHRTSHHSPPYASIRDFDSTLASDPCLPLRAW